jgi:hypothetical protein
MSDYKAKAIDRMEAEVVKPSDAGVKAPFFVAAFECVGPGNVKKWRDGFTNVVVTGGRAYLLNRIWFSATASTAGAALQLHSATTASDHAWSNISASRVTGYGNDVPRISLAASTASAAQTMSASYGFNATATQQTVLGGAILWYTSVSMSTNAATADICEYSEGQFGTTRTVTGNDTLNVTVTVSYA